MFRNTQGKGFQMTFENGNTISVQWGAGNYCENGRTDMMAWFNTKARDIDIKSTDAEIAVWDKDGNWITNVKGYMSADEVLSLMVKVAQ